MLAPPGIARIVSLVQVERGTATADDGGAVAALELGAALVEVAGADDGTATGVDGTTTGVDDGTGVEAGADTTSAPCPVVELVHPAANNATAATPAPHRAAGVTCRSGGRSSTAGSRP
jgi:hypothetical protein